MARARNRGRRKKKGPAGATPAGLIMQIAFAKQVRRGARHILGSTMGPAAVHKRRLAAVKQRMPLSLSSQSTPVHPGLPINQLSQSVCAAYMRWARKRIGRLISSCGTHVHTHTKRTVNHTPSLFHSRLKTLKLFHKSFLPSASTHRTVSSD